MPEDGVGNEQRAERGRRDGQIRAPVRERDREYGQEQQPDERCHRYSFPERFAVTPLAARA